VATQQQNIPRGETTEEHRIMSAKIDTKINQLRYAANHIAHRRLVQPRAYQEARDSVLDQILDGMRGIQDHLSRLENTSHDHSLRKNHNTAFDITYGRTTEDVRNHDPLNTYIKIKDARNMNLEIDETSRNQVQKFLNASTYAMSEINPADERFLLRVILCTKLTGKAMYDFQARDIRSFAQLKQEIEMCYLSKRGTAHILHEFNMTRQKPGESARKYELRLDKQAMELYQSNFYLNHFFVDTVIWKIFGSID